MFLFFKKIIFFSLAALTFNQINFSFSTNQKSITKYFDYQKNSENFFISDEWNFNDIFEEQKSQKINLKTISLCFYKTKFVNQKNNYNHIIKLNFDYKVLLNAINNQNVDFDIIKIFSHVKFENEENQRLMSFSLDILVQDILYSLYNTQIALNFHEFNFISLQMIYTYL